MRLLADDGETVPAPVAVGPAQVEPPTVRVPAHVRDARAAAGASPRGAERHDRESVSEFPVLGAYGEKFAERCRTQAATRELVLDLLRRGPAIEVHELDRDLGRAGPLGREVRLRDVGIPKSRVRRGRNEPRKLDVVVDGDGVSAEDGRSRLTLVPTTGREHEPDEQCPLEHLRDHLSFFLCPLNLMSRD